MIVKDALGGLHAFPASCTPVVLPSGLLQIVDTEKEPVAYFAAGGWLVVYESEDGGQ